MTWTKLKICPNWLAREQFDAFPDKLAVGELYVSRWNVELDQRNLKTTLGLERLHCKTPEINKKALWVGLLAYNPIRMLMAESAKQADVLPRLLSFKHSLQLWLTWNHGGPHGSTRRVCLISMV